MNWPVERLFAPFGAWRRHFDPATVRDRVGDGLAVVGVNTAHAWTTKHGRVRSADLADLERRLAALPPGLARVVVAHHPVAAGPELGSEPSARRGAELLRLSRRHGVDLVLCGHLHRSFSIPPERTLPGGGPLVVHCGTTLSSRGMRLFPLPLFLAATIVLLPALSPGQSRTIKDLPLEELDGTMSTMADYLGQGPVYITFWALWCEPCKQSSAP